MKLFNFIAVSLLFSAFGLNSYAGFPPNNLHLLDDVNRPANITEEQFNQIVDTVISAWAPLAKEQGANLVGVKAWKDSTVNASAEQKGSQWIVNMYGGLARRPEITLDGFVLVVCHELGHHFGGHYFYKGDKWAAAEGQADYFATDVCAKKIFSTFSRSNPRFREGVPPAVKAKCDTTWKTQPLQDLCYRSSAGGLSLANLLAVLGKTAAPHFETPDPTVVKASIDSHPNAQCRLDTYFAGAVCGAPYNVHDIPGKNVPQGNNSKEAEMVASKVSCTAANSPVGSRPNCWFKSQLTMGRN